MTELIVLGTALDESLPLSAASAAATERAQVLIGENRTVTMRRLRGLDVSAKRVFCLDPDRKDVREEMESALTELAKRGGTAVLFSDSGMPILFDPGAEVLALCRRLGYRVRATEGATSWGMAAALSGFPPPLLVAGFPPREPQERQAFLARHSAAEAAVVLMDTPYRFEVLLSETIKAFGPDREAFLAWNLTLEGERLLWSRLGDLFAATKKEGLHKGEFTLVVRKATKQRGSRR